MGQAFMELHSAMLDNDEPSLAECAAHLAAWNDLLYTMTTTERSTWFERTFPGSCDPEGN
jgi:hypothetical protein